MIAWIFALGLLAGPASPDAVVGDTNDNNGRLPEVPAAERLAIRADRVLLGDGSAIEGGVVLIENGRIRSVGAGLDVPGGVAVVDHDGTLSAGLIACRSFEGAWGGTADATRSILDQARIADQLETGVSELRKALEAGVTAVVIAPNASVACGGLSAVVKTHGGEVIDRGAHLSLSVGSAALNRNRYPTSIAGVMAELNERMASGEGHFGAAAAGRLPVFFHASNRDEVLRACAFAQAHGLNGAISGAWLGGEIADDIKASGLSAILGPYTTGSSTRNLKSAVALAKAGVPVGLALDGPGNPALTLRTSAARLVRTGMEPAAALRALTSDAARIAGVDTRVGRIERGMDADLVLWSGDPLDLTSSVVAVYVDGELAHGGGE